VNSHKYNAKQCGEALEEFQSRPPAENKNKHAFHISASEHKELLVLNSIRIV
jgi:hypothetical protein